MSIESYGVGVLPDEIHTGRIYEHGERGALARDRNRTGSGIGLSEAKRIAEAHGGSVILESRPVMKDQHEDANASAYITTVDVQLPSGGRQ